MNPSDPPRSTSAYHSRHNSTQPPATSSANNVVASRDPRLALAAGSSDAGSVSTALSGAAASTSSPATVGMAAGAGVAAPVSQLQMEFIKELKSFASIVSECVVLTTECDSLGRKMRHCDMELGKLTKISRRSQSCSYIGTIEAQHKRTREQLNQATSQLENHTRQRDKAIEALAGRISLLSQASQSEDLDALRKQTNKDLAAVRTETTGQIQQLRNETQRKIHESKAETETDVDDVRVESRRRLEGLKAASKKQMENLRSSNLTQLNSLSSDLKVAKSDISTLQAESHKMLEGLESRAGSSDTEARKLLEEFSQKLQSDYSGFRAELSQAIEDSKLSMNVAHASAQENATRMQKIEDNFARLRADLTTLDKRNTSVPPPSLPAAIPTNVNPDVIEAMKKDLLSLNQQCEVIRKTAETQDDVFGEEFEKLDKRINHVQGQIDPMAKKLQDMEYRTIRRPPPSQQSSQSPASRLAAVAHFQRSSPLTSSRATSQTVQQVPPQNTAPSPASNVPLPYQQQQQQQQQLQHQQPQPQPQPHQQQDQSQSITRQSPHPFVPQTPSDNVPLPNQQQPPTPAPLSDNATYLKEFDAQLKAVHSTLRSHTQVLEQLQTAYRHLDLRYSNMTSEPIVKSMIEAMRELYPFAANAQEEIMLLKHQHDQLSRTLNREEIQSCFEEMNRERDRLNGELLNQTSEMSQLKQGIDDVTQETRTLRTDIGTFSGVAASVEKLKDIYPLIESLRVRTDEVAKSVKEAGSDAHRQQSALTQGGRFDVPPRSSSTPQGMKIRGMANASGVSGSPDRSMDSSTEGDSYSESNARKRTAQDAFDSNNPRMSD